MKPLSIVFLDFDGVINSLDTFTNHRDSTGIAVSGDDRIDRGLVGRVNQLLELTGAKVVVSSTWRIGRIVAELQALLERHGFTGEVIGTTPILGGNRVRGDEIQAWLSREGENVRSFVILDDDSDMVHLHDRLVQTTFKTGLQDHHVSMAVTVLRRPVRRARRRA